MAVLQQEAFTMKFIKKPRLLSLFFLNRYTCFYCSSQVMLFYLFFLQIGHLYTCPTLYWASTSAQFFLQHLLTSCLCHIVVIVAVFKIIIIIFVILICDQCFFKINLFILIGG